MELKPCPFCGSRGAHKKNCYINLYFESEVLGADIPLKVMAEAWNTRYERTCRIEPFGRILALFQDGTTLCDSCCSECGTYIDENDNYCSGRGAKVVK